MVMPKVEIMYKHIKWEILENIFMIQLVLPVSMDEWNNEKADYIYSQSFRVK